MNSLCLSCNPTQTRPSPLINWHLIEHLSCEARLHHRRCSHLLVTHIATLRPETTSAPKGPIHLYVSWCRMPFHTAILPRCLSLFFSNFDSNRHRNPSFPQLWCPDRKVHRLVPIVRSCLIFNLLPDPANQYALRHMRHYKWHDLGFWNWNVLVLF